MKLTVLALLPLTFLLACSSMSISQTAEDHDVEVESYAIGHDMGSAALESLRLDGVPVNVDALLKGVEDALRERPSAFTDEEIEDALADLERRVATRLAEEQLRQDPVFRALAEDNARRGAAFQARFASEKDTKRLPGGVLYKVVASGDGPRVSPDGSATVAFTAKLIDGHVVGETDGRDLRVGSTLQGGGEALANMRVGDHWIVVIPHDKAFALAGRAPDVGPNETVVVDLKVLGIPQ